MNIIFFLVLLIKYSLSCASTASAANPVTTSTPVTTTTTTEITTTTTTEEITTTTTTAAALTCPANYVLFETNCYFYEATPTDPQAAVTACMMMGANAVSIHSQAQNDFIQMLVNGAIIYIGAVRPDPTTVDFIWTDGTPFVYNNWAPGDPSGGAVEFCVQMNTNGNDGMWDNTGCTDMLGYVCEVAAT